MKRAALLPLLAAAPLSSCAGLARYARSRIKGCPVPELPPVGGIATSVRTASLQSRYVHGPVRMWSIEAGTAPIRRIVWALPGRGADASGQPLFLRPYLSKLAIGGVAVITIEGGESYWHPRTAGEDRLSMLLDEAVPWAMKLYNLRKRMGIIGWSMGGYGAINVTEQSPNLFDCACGVSPALWKSSTEQEGAVPDAFDNAASFDRYNAFTHAKALRDVRIRLTCGSSDPFYPNTVAFAQALRHDRVPVETDFFEHGCHDTASWQRTITSDLAFVLGKEHRWKLSRPILER